MYCPDWIEGNFEYQPNFSNGLKGVVLLNPGLCSQFVEPISGNNFFSLRFDQLQTWHRK